MLDRARDLLLTPGLNVKVGLKPRRREMRSGSGSGRVQREETGQQKHIYPNEDERVGKKKTRLKLEMCKF